MTTRAKLALIGIVATILHGALSFAEKRGPSTAEERAMAVQLTRGLEADPLASDAKASRRWLTIFFIDVPDIDFTVCASLFGPVLKAKYLYSPEINTQMIYTSGAFVIE